ncbi:hybrid sensor histidine kinase/response regulator [Thiopseudomonas acetoxidans]|uniref:histidine kinase n=1 Tax=Thiopseudomonas acetoxidans TaxID=3041622 RepID=A0ABT7SR25_9GAMM|nr:hybrid sensor histidine kinase/response regulator [Thiopseudomonas sp. CY1220]MDM7858646.1 hybrid sensor histidine kinase/response regulator [Thiopseudomonas sp. CY1220]
MVLDITKFLNRFIDEARDLLGYLGEGVKNLEQGQCDAELINSLFRSAHTVKGSSRMLKLQSIADTAHSLEELLSALRDQKITVTQPIVDGIYQAVDSLSDMVEQLASSQDPNSLPSAPQALCDALLALAAGEKSAPTTAQPLAQPVSMANEVAAAQTSKPQPALASSDSVRLRLESLESLSKLISEVTASHAGLRELVRDAQALKLSWESAQDAVLSKQRFDSLFNNLKEIVGSQEALIYSLHDQAMGLRMLPLKQVFEPAAKHIREVGRMLGKQVSSQISGEHIELDRSIIEQLSEPLVHLLRNAMDHGIEEPQTRLDQGKPAAGLLKLSAWQDGGWVVIELSDDGAGLSLEKIRQKLAKQQLSADEIANMGEQELFNQVFLPGFTTASMITEISGRGVGLDVVKRKVVDDLQGLIEVRSQEGKGTSFTLRLPLSLAMLRVLLVETAGHMLGFSAQYVVELTRITPEQILEVADRNVFVLRNEFVPIFELHQLIGLPNLTNTPGQISKNLLLLVVRVQHEKIALVIDRLVDEHDLIINTLPEHLAHNPLVSGMVNHGYQQLVSLIHVPRLLELARKKHQKTADNSIKSITQQHLLVVDDSLNTREIERDVLEAWGYQVTLAEDGLDGLNKARNGDFDAIITDVEMPFMDGFTLTTHLREHERYKNRPIIIITSREKDSDRRRGIEVGADAYIVKGSFDQNNLVDTIRALLG